MSQAESLVPVSAPPPGPPWVYRLSVDQYHAMLRAGVFESGDRVELLEGVLVPKMSINPTHRVATRNVRLAFERAVPPGYYVEQQQPITLATSEPEPDVSVVRGSSEDYADRHPGPSEVPVVVEVADASLPRDKSEKKRIYAQAAIPTYWLVNLASRRIEVYTEPTGPDPSPDYRRREDRGVEDEVVLSLDGREVARLAVRELLPKQPA